MIAGEVMYPAGLLWCCRKSLREITEPSKDGDKRVCGFCNATLVFQSKVWRWEGDCERSSTCPQRLIYS